MVANVAAGEVGEIVCWTKMQAEAGQELERIVARKEAERRAGGGLFLWGVGNAPARAVPQIVKAGIQVDVLFSIMKTPPKKQDSAPSRVVAWRQMSMPGGGYAPVPANSLVTSRATGRDHHFALICRSDHPLALADLGPFDPLAFRNYGGEGGQIGASQVTALVQRIATTEDGPYRIAMRARLALGYWVKLIDPVELDESARAMLDEPIHPEEWPARVEAVMSSAKPVIRSAAATLFDPD